MIRTFINRKQLHPEIQEQLEELKKMHDYNYAKKCVLDKLEAEYQTMIDTDLWYDAAKRYLRDKISTSKLDSLIWDFKYKHNLLDSQLQGICYAPDYYGNVLIADTANGEGMIYHDIEFNIRDGKNKKKISIKELHNPYPDVHLDDDFKMHCINYKRRYEE